MTKLSSQRSKDDWEKELAAIEKKVHSRDEADKLYNVGETRNGKKVRLKDGEIFMIKGAKMKYPRSEQELDAWCIGVFISGKFLYVIFDEKDNRLPRLKRQAVASLLRSVKTGFADTRQAPWLPRKMQSIKNPDLELWAGNSVESDLENMKDKKTIKSKESILASFS